MEESQQSKAALEEQLKELSWEGKENKIRWRTTPVSSLFPERRRWVSFTNPWDTCSAAKLPGFVKPTLQHKHPHVEVEFTICF